jgi:alpha-galactosidase
MRKNVTIIGGGSSTFVPFLLSRLMQSELLGASAVTLMDVNAGRLQVMESLARKLIASEQSELTVGTTVDQRESLVDADFVIVAISVGGMEAWEQDLEIPGRYGVVMHVGDSIGPGGIMRALRNVPVLASVARDVAEVAPDAHIFNYTNPAAAEALGLLTVPEVKSLSLCSCTAHPASVDWLASQAGVDPAAIAMPPVVAGLNHCASVTELRLRDGRDALPLVRERAENPVVKWALDTFGVLPYCWSHWVEFFPQLQWLEEPYAGTAQGVSMRYGITTHDMNYERARVREQEELAARWASPESGPMMLADLPPGDEDEGIEVIAIMEAILDNRNETHVVNVRNGGTIPNLPADAVVEVTALVNAYGIRPIATPPLPEALAAHLRHYAALQHQMVEAALSGDRRAALQAFLLDPMLQARLDVEQTEALLDELLAAQAEHLPRFALEAV